MDAAAPGSPGRVCPRRYRYGAAALAGVPVVPADTLYVIGGLYGNLQALDAVQALARHEAGRPTLCFNGDFNWFDIDDAVFAAINGRVLAHDAILGNVEAEFDAPDGDDAGCGCAYPEHVDAALVERSNHIHRLLRATAQRHPALRERLARLPMFRRYRVAGCTLGVVHGDADALAGWRFDVQALDDPAQAPWRRAAFAAARVDLFASTHTCLPALRRVPLADGGSGWVVNNGAAGMPNFRGRHEGLVTRIGHTPSPHPVLFETVVAGAHVALLPLALDQARWQAAFRAQWPPGSPAWVSYHTRIVDGPDYRVEQCLPPPLRHESPSHEH